MQRQLADAGIRTTIKIFAIILFNTPDGPVRNGRFTVAIDGWLGGADPEQSIVFTCGQATANGSNISHYCDPRFDALFADQQRTSSNAVRGRDFVAMQQLVHAALPVIPLYYETLYEGVDRHVTGFGATCCAIP